MGRGVGRESRRTRHGCWAEKRPDRVMSRWADGESRRCRGRSGQPGSRAWAERLSLERDDWETNMHAGAIRGRGAIAAGWGIPVVRRPAERVQGTSVLADRTRSAQQQQGKSNA